MLKYLFYTRKHILFLVVSIIISGSILSLYGIFDYLISMGTHYWKGQITSTYANHNHFAGWIEMSLPLAIGLLEYTNEKGKKIILYYCIIIMGTALLLSLSRGGWISCSISLFIMSYFLTRKHIISQKNWIIIIVLFVFFISSILGFSIISNRFKTFKKFMEDPVNFDN